MLPTRVGCAESMGSLPPDESAYIAAARQRFLRLLKQTARRLGPGSSMFTARKNMIIIPTEPQTKIAASQIGRVDRFLEGSKGIISSFPLGWLICVYSPLHFH